MPSRKPPPKPERPLWALVTNGKVVACPKGLPEGAVLFCREGDGAWAVADPSDVAVPLVKIKSPAPSLYDQMEAK